MQCPVALASETMCTCFGARCMAWRWFADLRRHHRVCADTQATREPERPADLPPDWEFFPCDTDPAGWVESEATATLRRLGSCGMVRA